MKYTKDMFIRFASYFKKHRVLFITDLIVAFVLAGIELVYPAFTTKIIDQLIPNKLLIQMLLMVGLLLGLYILMAGCSYFHELLGACRRSTHGSGYAKRSF